MVVWGNPLCISPGLQLVLPHILGVHGMAHSFVRCFVITRSIWLLTSLDLAKLHGGCRDLALCGIDWGPRLSVQ